MKHHLWCQKWEETERGWGTRPDGYTLHLTKACITGFVQAIRDNEAKLGYGSHNVPDEYSRPAGAPYLTETEDDILYEKVIASAWGVWGADRNNYPTAIPAHEQVSKTGWVNLPTE